jgi:hypothetical protein
LTGTGTELQIAVGSRLCVVGRRYRVTAWNRLYPVFITSKEYDRGGKTFQSIRILFLIFYLPLLTFVNVVVTIFTFSEFFSPHTQMGDVKAPFIQAYAVFMPDIC